MFCFIFFVFNYSMGKDLRSAIFLLVLWGWVVVAVPGIWWGL